MVGAEAALVWAGMDASKKVTEVEVEERWSHEDRNHCSHCPTCKAMYVQYESRSHSNQSLSSSTYIQLPDHRRCTHHYTRSNRCWSRRG